MKFIFGCFHIHTHIRLSALISCIYTVSCNLSLNMAACPVYAIDYVDNTSVCHPVVNESFWHMPLNELIFYIFLCKEILRGFYFFVGFYFIAWYDQSHLSVCLWKVIRNLYYYINTYIYLSMFYGYIYITVALQPV